MSSRRGQMRAGVSLVVLAGAIALAAAGCGTTSAADADVAAPAGGPDYFFTFQATPEKTKDLAVQGYVSPYGWTVFLKKTDGSGQLTALDLNPVHGNKNQTGTSGRQFEGITLAGDAQNPERTPASMWVQRLPGSEGNFTGSISYIEVIGESTRSQVVNFAPFKFAVPTKNSGCIPFPKQVVTYDNKQNDKQTEAWGCVGKNAAGEPTGYLAHQAAGGGAVAALVTGEAQPATPPQAQPTTPPQQTGGTGLGGLLAGIALPVDHQHVVVSTAHVQERVNGGTVVTLRNGFGYQGSASVPVGPWGGEVQCPPDDGSPDERSGCLLIQRSSAVMSILETPR